jgi:hypothetical protein
MSLRYENLFPLRSLFTACTSSPSFGEVSSTSWGQHRGRVLYSCYLEAFWHGSKEPSLRAISQVVRQSRRARSVTTGVSWTLLVLLEGRREVPFGRPGGDLGPRGES